MYTLSKTEMSDIREHELRCLVERDSDTIPLVVVVSLTMKIYALKTTIKGQIQTELAAHKLILWKVCSF